MSASLSRYTFQHLQTGDFHAVYATSAEQAREMGALNAAWRLVEFKPLRRFAA